MALQTTETEAERAVYIAHDRVGLTHQVLAEAIAEPGLSVADAKAFIRNMGAAGYVRPYGRGRADKRTPHLYRPDAALALAVLLRASEAGFSSPDARKALGHAIQNWQPGDEPGPLDLIPRSPGTLIMAAYADGFRNFAADIAFFHQPGQRKPLVSARYRQMQDGTERGTNFAPEAVGLELRSSWSCPLDPVLAHLMRRREAIH
ncbi:hypothetical protein [Alterinioella nitratireducens]|uniref:hypothetical protein n=1 Tax=Alterinioella nitratireducens TaxID=2735915 RepID=UPI0040584B71